MVESKKEIIKDLSEEKKKEIEDLVRENEDTWEYSLQMCLKYSNEFKECAKRVLIEIIDFFDYEEDLQEVIKRFLDKVQEYNDSVDLENYKNEFEKKNTIIE